jgi:hypothetical protein
LRDLNHEFDRVEWPPNFSNDTSADVSTPAAARCRNAERRQAGADSGIKVSGKPIETARSPLSEA